MRVLILGGAGMLGHKLWQRYVSWFDTWVTLRSSADAYDRYGLFIGDRTIGGVDVSDFDSVVRAIARVRPDVVINAIGVIKQLPTAHDPLISISINSLFPHRLAALGTAAGARVIHVSTDCVFSGRKGCYTEADVADAEDLYGRSKWLGELAGAPHLTLRTSIIGRELSSASGLVEWFLQNRDAAVKGYTQAMFSGLTTDAFAAILGEIIEKHPTLNGVYHLSADAISKHDLLCLLRDAYDSRTRVDPAPLPALDRTLDSSKLREATGLAPPSWSEMIRAMAGDPTPYEDWRETRA